MTEKNEQPATKPRPAALLGEALVLAERIRTLMQASGRLAAYHVAYHRLSTLEALLRQECREAARQDAYEGKTQDGS